MGSLQERSVHGGSITTTKTMQGSRSPRIAPAVRMLNALLAIRKSEVLRGVFRRPVKITFGEFSKRYMEHAKMNKVLGCETNKCSGI